jgi:hypothetical protein
MKVFIEGTCQQLSPEKALYAQALIEGDDFSVWHSQFRNDADFEGLIGLLRLDRES